jgi:cell division inhibitor SepF
MASAMRKMAVYLGLVEDDHRYDEHYSEDYGSDEYDEYGDQGDLLDTGDRQEVHAGHGDVSLENGRSAYERYAGTATRATATQTTTLPGLPPCIRRSTMRPVRSESTSAGHSGDHEPD